MLLYISNSLGGHNGSGQSGIDVLIALLKSRHTVLVCTCNSRKVAQRLHKLIDESPLWIDFPGSNNFPREANARFALQVFQYLKKTIQLVKFRAIMSHQEPQLAIVNSLGSHNYWLSVK